MISDGCSYRATLDDPVNQQLTAMHSQAGITVGRKTSGW